VGIGGHVLAAILDPSTDVPLRDREMN
jgi:hypothetical protein